MNLESKEAFLILVATVWGITLLFVHGMRYRQAKLVLVMALGLHILLNTVFLIVNFVDFSQSGWISMDGAIAIIGSGLGWSVIACCFVGIACQAWKCLPLKWQTVRFVELPYTIDAIFPRHSVLTQILFVSHATVVSILWLGIELVGGDSTIGTVMLGITAYLEWSLLLVNLAYWSITDESQGVLGLMLPALIFGTMVYTALGWLVDLVQGPSVSESPTSAT